MLTSLAALPIQVNFVASNLVLLWPISGSIAIPRAMMPNCVPSRAATL
jgi:hypothetical protein